MVQRFRHVSMCGQAFASLFADELGENALELLREGLGVVVVFGGEMIREGIVKISREYEYSYSMKSVFESFNFVDGQLDEPLQ